MKKEKEGDRGKAEQQAREEEISSIRDEARMEKKGRRGKKVKKHSMNRVARIGRI